MIDQVELEIYLRGNTIHKEIIDDKIDMAGGNGGTIHVKDIVKIILHADNLLLTKKGLKRYIIYNNHHI